MLAISTTSSLALLPASSLKHPPKSVKQTYTFPSASPPTAIAWSSDNASLFATSTSSLTHFTASGDLTAVIPVHDGAENLLIKDKSALLFSITGTSKIHIRSVSNPEKTAQVIDTHKAPKVITSLALSNDGSLLVSTCATGVHVHNLTLNSHTVLRGIPAGVITTSAFHPHARTRLLLGIGAQLVVYDTTRPSGPSKVITISVDGGTPGHVVDIACSPFSKTLVGVGMSGGWVGLVDLDKEKALFRVLPTYAPLTALVFTPNGASLAAGTENGKVMLIDLRALDRPAATFCIGEGAGNGDRIVGIAVQTKNKQGADPAPKSTASSTTNSTRNESDRQPSVTTVRQTVSGDKRSLPSSPAQSKKQALASGRPRTLPTRNVSGQGSDKEKGKAAVRKGKETVKAGEVFAKEKGKDNDRGKKPLFPARDPLGNTQAGGHVDLLNEADLSVQFESIRDGRDGEGQGMLKEFAIPVASIFSTRTNGASDTSNPTAAINSDSPGAHSTINDHLPSHTRTVSGASRDTPDRVGSALSTRSHEENAFARLGLRTESASSGRVKLRSGAGATVSDSVSMSGRTRASVLGEGTGVLGQEGESSASGRLRRRAADKLAPSSSASDRASSSARSSSKLRDGTSTLSAFPSREALSHGPRASVGEMPSPSVLEDQMAVPDSTRAEEDVGSRMPNAETMPERASKEKGNSKKVGFAQRGEDSDGDGEGDLSVVLSAQRHPPAAQPNVWTTVPSPHFQPPEKGYNASASNSSHAPQDLLRSLISDVLCDFQRNQQADMVGLHVDLVRMGRGWTRELEGVRRELAELREENKVLREENARWRRGY